MFENILRKMFGLLKHPKLILFIILGLTLLMLIPLSRISIDNDISHMIPENNIDRQLYSKYEKIFGNSEYIFIGFESDDIFTPENLTYLRTFSASVRDLNMSIPIELYADLLRISVEDAALLIQAINEEGLYDGESILGLLKDRNLLGKTYGLSETALKKISLAAKKTPPDILWSNYELPIKEVESLLTSSYIRSENGTIVTEKLLEEDPITEEGIRKLKERLSDWDLYQGGIISYDGKLSTVMVQLSSTFLNKRTAVLRGVQKILEQKPASLDLKAHISGEPIIVDSISAAMLHDMRILIPLVLIVVILVLFLSFRNLEGVLYPLLAMALSIIWSLGIMSLLGVPINMISTVLPVLLVAVGSAYGIHFMSSYFHSPLRDKLEALQENFGDIGISITMAALTTVAGFGSLVTTSFIPIRNFGVFTAVGIFFALLIVLFLLPSLIILSKKEKTILHVNEEEYRKDFLHNILTKLGKWLSQARTPILLFSLALMAIMTIGIFKVNVDMNYVEFFKPKSPIRQADRILNEKLAGTQTLNIVITGKEGENVLRPDLLMELDAFVSLLKEDFPSIKKDLSIITLLKRMNRVMHDNSPAYDAIPETQQAIEDYMLLYSGNSSYYVTQERDMMRIVLSLKRTSTSDIEKIESRILSKLDQSFQLRHSVEIAITGIAQIQLRINDLIVRGQIMNILISILAVFIINLLVFRKFSITLLSLFPIFFSLVISFGVMGFLGIPLNAGTAMVAAVSIGIGIDYAIHFLVRYSSALRAGKEMTQCIHEALVTRGRSITTNVIAVCAGFFVLTFSGFIPLVQFGLFVILNMVTSSLAALVILPALILTQKKKTT